MRLDTGNKIRAGDEPGFERRAGKSPRGFEVRRGDERDAKLGGTHAVKQIFAKAFAGFKDLNEIGKCSKKERGAVSYPV